MKNTLKLIGIIALIAIIGFSFAACRGDDGGGGGGGTGSGGTITITDIPLNYNGMYVQCVGPSSDFYSSSDDGYNMGIYASPISNGRISVPLWTEHNKRYSGNATGTIKVYIYRNRDSVFSSTVAWADFDSVTFSNGSATVSQ